MRIEYEGYKKLTNKQKECLAVVESLGIYELRALSRVFGNNSPTTLKRNQHIKLIMDKIVSEEEVRPLPLRQGRPYKELNNLEAILNQLSEITGVSYAVKAAKTSQNKKSITFKQVEKDIFSKHLSPVKAKGIVLQNIEGKYYFQNQNNGVNILVDEKYYSKLSEYDFVEGKAVVMNSDKEYMMTEISSLNFVPFAKYTGQGPKSTAKSVVSNGKTFTLGKKYRFDNTTRFTEKKDEIKPLVDALKNAKVSTLAIIPNVAEEELMSVQLLGFDSLVAFSVTEQPESIYEMIVYAVDYVRHQKEIGSSVAIFVQDPVTLANMVDYCFKTNLKVFMNHTENVAEIVREFSTIVENCKNQTITSFSTCDSVDVLDPLYVSLIYKNYKPIKL